MLVLRRMTDAPAVSTPLGWPGRARVRAARAVAKRLGAALSPGEPGMLSLGLLPSGLGRAIRDTPADIVHLHWVGGEAMSLGEIAEIRKPMACTLHDAWAVSGAEHYRTRPPGQRGAADAWVWRRKCRLWSRLAPALVCPSRWMAGEVQAASPFGSAAGIEVIPNTLAPDIFRAVEDRRALRARLGLPAAGKVLLFGAQSSTSDPRKGFDLLRAALEHLDNQGTTATLAVFGAGSRETPPSGSPVVWLGPLSEEASLAEMYAAADVFVAPSRQDNFPNTVLEAQFCGTPVAAFAIGGMRDLVLPGETGALAAPFEASALATAIREALSLPETGRAAIRQSAMDRFGPEVVVARHTALYRHLLGAEHDMKGT